MKWKKGGGKANIALARKLLGIVYRTIRNGWVFEDFPSFRLKGGIIPVWSRDEAKKYTALRWDFPGRLFLRWESVEAYAEWKRRDIAKFWERVRKWKEEGRGKWQR